MISQVDLLKWIDEQEYAQYGECYGKMLDKVIADGLVQVHGPGEHDTGFIAKGRTLPYRAVSLTEAGKEWLKK